MDLSQEGEGRQMCLMVKRSHGPVLHLHDLMGKVSGSADGPGCKPRPSHAGDLQLAVW